MAKAKKKPAEPTIDNFLAGISDPSRKKDCVSLIDLMKKVTKCQPKMWGASMVGFGDFHYRYATGREGDTFLIGFASRKPDLTLYLGCNLQAETASLKELGKHKIGKGCLYLRSLDDVNLTILRGLLSKATAFNASMHVPRKSDD